MEELKIFGNNIRRKRESLNQTLLWLSEQSDYNRNSLSTIELGEHDILLSTSIKIARALNMSFVELLVRNCSISDKKFIEDDFYFIFCENIERKMKKMYINQNYFHSKINMEAPNVNRILNRKINDPQLGTLLKMAKAVAPNHINSMFERSEKK